MGQRNSDLCPDGTYKQIGFCEASLTSPQAGDVSGVTATGEVNIDRDDGRLYGRVTTDNTPLTTDDIINNPDDSAPVASSGVNTLSAFGLSVSTNYYWQMAHLNPSGWKSAPVVSPMFTTLADATSFDFVGIPYPTETTPELTALGYTPWPYDPTTEQVPALPSGAWDSDIPGFYFIAQGGTNTGWGNRLDPRGDLPTPVGAGEIIVVSGEINVGRNTQRITFNGTSSDICWVVPDPDNAEGGIFRATDHVWTGSHVIFDHMKSYTDTGFGSVHGVDGGSYVTFRHCEFKGDRVTSNQGMSLYGDSHHIMVYNNDIYDWGNWNSTSDDNRHGIKVYAAHDFWIIQNKLHDNTNDGMQIGDRNTPTIRRGFVAGNVCYNNAQTGVWLKNCYDIIISTNTFHTHIAHPAGDSGYYFWGGQYDIGDIWWVNNLGYGAGGGFYIGSNNGPSQAEGERYMVGNLLVNTTNPDYDVSDTHLPAGITDRNSGWPCHIVNNTLVNCHAGISRPDATGYITGNLVTETQFPGAWSLFIFDNSVTEPHILDYNFFETDRIRLITGDNTGQADFNALGYNLNGATEATLTFEDPASGDYSPAVGSDALDNNVESPVYGIFLSRYGKPINIDRNGTVRPQGASWDVGAYERAV